MPSLVPLLALAACLQDPQRSESDPTWRITLEPYVWLPSLSGRGETSSSPELDVNVVGEFDVGFPLALRAERPDGRAFTLDALYARWRDSEGSLRTETDVLLLEGGHAWPVGRGCELAAGLRYLEVGFEVTLGPGTGKSDASLLDPWVGARSELALGDDLALRLGADVGGFGVGSDFSWQALALLAWRPAAAWRLELGYRALALDFEDEGLSYDLQAYGPILGLALQL